MSYPNAGGVIEWDEARDGWSSTAYRLQRGDPLAQDLLNGKINPTPSSLRSRDEDRILANDNRYVCRSTEWGRPAKILFHHSHLNFFRWRQSHLALSPGNRDLQICSFRLPKALLSQECLGTKKYPMANTLCHLSYLAIRVCNIHRWGVYIK